MNWKVLLIIISFVLFFTIVFVMVVEVVVLSDCCFWFWLLFSPPSAFWNILTFPRHCFLASCSSLVLISNERKDWLFLFLLGSFVLEDFTCNCEISRWKHIPNRATHSSIRNTALRSASPPPLWRIESDVIWVKQQGFSTPPFFFFLVLFAFPTFSSSLILLNRKKKLRSISPGVSLPPRERCFSICN